MKRVVFSCLAAALIAFPGCSNRAGPKTMRVWGEVSFDGKPVQDGTITFEGANGSAPAQGQIKGGHFDTPAGSGPVAEKVYLVKINALTKSGKTVKNIMDDTSPTMDVMAETIPSMFNT